MNTNENPVENSTQPVVVSSPEVDVLDATATMAVPVVSTVPVPQTEEVPVLDATATMQPVPAEEVPVLDATATMPIPVPEAEPTIQPVSTEEPVLTPTVVVPVGPDNPSQNVPNLGTPVPAPVSSDNPSQNVPNLGTPASTDEGAIVNEKLKSVEINYKPPSKVKTFFLILFFICLIGFVVFLPEITSMVKKYKEGKVHYTPEVITTGKLRCSLDTNTTNLDKSYDLTYHFTDSKLERTNFVITTRGSATLDAETLDALAATCKELSESNLEGVTIQCSYTDGKLVETQKFDLAVLDPEQVDAAFVEAGGNNPEYQYGQDIDIIERSMNASGYTCKREK